MTVASPGGEAEEVPVERCHGGLAGLSVWRRGRLQRRDRRHFGGLAA